MRRIVAFAVLSLLASSSLFAQFNKGTITGGQRPSSSGVFTAGKAASSGVFSKGKAARADVRLIDIGLVGNSRLLLTFRNVGNARTDRVSVSVTVSDANGQRGSNSVTFPLAPGVDQTRVLQFGDLRFSRRKAVRFDQELLRLQIVFEKKEVDKDSVELRNIPVSAVP
jgi:hypothetical protein